MDCLAAAMVKIVNEGILLAITDMVVGDGSTTVDVAELEEDWQLDCPPLPAAMHCSTVTGTSGAYPLHIDTLKTADLVKTLQPQLVYMPMQNSS